MTQYTQYPQWTTPPPQSRGPPGPRGEPGYGAPGPRGDPGPPAAHGREGGVSWEERGGRGGREGDDRLLCINDIRNEGYTHKQVHTYILPTTSPSPQPPTTLIPPPPPHPSPPHTSYHTLAWHSLHFHPHTPHIPPPPTLLTTSPTPHRAPQYRDPPVPQALPDYPGEVATTSSCTCLCPDLQAPGWVHLLQLLQYDMNNFSITIIAI